MQVGGKRQVVLPPELAYGQTGRPPRVPRDATVVFEFELISSSEPRIAPEAPPAFVVTDMIEVQGVKILDLSLGTGRTVQVGDVIALDYSGWTASGSRFDSSLTRPTPSNFIWGSGEMVDGVDKGLTGMKVGGQRLLVVPPELGYGTRGLRGLIPPDETLTFVVELVEAAPR